MSRLMMMGLGSPNVIAGPDLWTPEDEASLAGWWDMRNYSNYDGNQWYKSYGATAGTWLKETVGPTKVTDGIDGTANALEFTGTTNKNLVLADPGVTEFIVVMVLDFSVLNFDAPIFQRDDDSPPTRIFAFQGAGMRVDYFAGSIDEYEANTSSPSIIVARMSSASRISRHNGIQLATGTTPTFGTIGASNTLKIGFYDSISRDFTYTLSAFGLFNSSGWSNTLAEKIEGYCAWVGGLGVSAAQLPVGHPYKAAAPTV